MGNKQPKIKSIEVCRGERSHSLVSKILLVEDPPSYEAIVSPKVETKELTPAKLCETARYNQAMTMASNLLTQAKSDAALGTNTDILHILIRHKKGQGQSYNLATGTVNLWSKVHRPMDAYCILLQHWTVVQEYLESYDVNLYLAKKQDTNEKTDRCLILRWSSFVRCPTEWKGFTILDPKEELSILHPTIDSSFRKGEL